jgi:hypothetical protein
VTSPDNRFDARRVYEVGPDNHPGAWLRHD